MKAAELLYLRLMELPQWDGADVIPLLTDAIDEAEKGVRRDTYRRIDNTVDEMVGVWAEGWAVPNMQGTYAGDSLCDDIRKLVRDALTPKEKP